MAGAQPDGFQARRDLSGANTVEEPVVAERALKRVMLDLHTTGLRLHGSAAAVDSAATGNVWWEEAVRNLNKPGGLAGAV